MEPVILKSTPKTFKFGFYTEFGEFVGITIKGADITYDPVTGFPNAGTLRWIEFDNERGYFTDAPRGNYTLTNFDITDIAALNTAQAGWFLPEGFFDLYGSQSAPKMTLERNQSDFNGTDGNDTIIVNALSYSGGVIDGGAGDDVLQGSLGSDTLLGGAGNDKLTGDTFYDLLAGGTGDDFIYGGAGADSLFGNDGADFISGGADDDTIFGDADGFGPGSDPAGGADTINGGSGHDMIFGNGGDDLLRGNLGNDSFYGGMGSDSIWGGIGNDTIYGDDTPGTGGDDRLYGGAGDDQISSGGGNDLLFGGDGNDLLSLEAGDDKAYGGTGDDTFVVYNGGNDLLRGGAGADWFIFDSATVDQARIVDFDVLEDTISIAVAVATTQQEQYDAFMAGAVQSGQNVVWTDADTTIILSRLDLADLTLDNFADIGGAQVATY